MIADGRPHLLICPPKAWKSAIDLKQTTVLDTLKHVAKQLKLVLHVNDEQGKVYLGPPDEQGLETGADRPGRPAVPPLPGKPIGAPAEGMLSEHFSEEEFRDGLGRLEQVQNLRRLAAKLEQLRKRVGKPIHVTSGYRSPEWNARVGGVPNSYHVQGMAADIWVDGMSVDQLADAARAEGFGGIGRYFRQSFVHVDIGPRADWRD